MRKKKQQHRKGRGAVLVIAVMFLLSAMLRLGSGAGDALAEATSPEQSAIPDSISEGGQRGETSGMVTTDVSAPLDRVKVGGLLTALQEREKRVSEKEAKIAIRSKALAMADAEISKRLVILEQAEANLRSTLALANGAAEDDLARLTSVYENMKPKDASALFAAMEPDFAAGFLGRMRPDAAAAVMAGLPPETAYSISVILAGRNAKVPKT